MSSAASRRAASNFASSSAVKAAFCSSNPAVKAVCRCSSRVSSALRSSMSARCFSIVSTSRADSAALLSTSPFNASMRVRFSVSHCASMRFSASSRFCGSFIIRVAAMRESSSSFVKILLPAIFTRPSASSRRSSDSPYSLSAPSRRLLDSNAWRNA